MKNEAIFDAAVEEFVWLGCRAAVGKLGGAVVKAEWLEWFFKRPANRRHQNLSELYGEGLLALEFIAVVRILSLLTEVMTAGRSFLGVFSTK